MDLHLVVAQDKRLDIERESFELLHHSKLLKDGKNRRSKGHGSTFCRAKSGVCTKSDEESVLCHPAPPLHDPAR